MAKVIRALIMVVGLMQSAATYAADTPSSLCVEPAIGHPLERALIAQTRAESGAKPWVVVIDGKPFNAQSRDAALRVIKSAANTKSITVGCYQLDVRAHLPAFGGDISRLLDPARQTQYVAQHPEWLFANRGMR